MAQLISETIGSAVAGTAVRVLPGKLAASLRIGGAGNSTFVLEASHDNTNFLGATYPNSSSAISFVNAEAYVVIDVAEPTWFRWRCSAYTAGNKIARLGQ